MMTTRKDNNPKTETKAQKDLGKKQRAAAIKKQKHSQLAAALAWDAQHPENWGCFD